MPSLLISIRRARWYAASTTFRAAPDVLADCLFDLRIAENELSAWYLDDGESHLERILTALSATRDTASNIDYLVFDYRVPTDFDIVINESKGGTPDAEANKLWHRDLRKLSARQAADFAVELHRSGVRGRLPEKRVKALIVRGVQQRQLDPAKMKSDLVQKLNLGQQRPSTWGRIARLFRRI